MPGQRRQHRQQALLDRRRLERAEQHDERPLPAQRLHGAGERGPVGLGDLRLAGRPARPRGRPVASRAPASRSRARTRRSPATKSTRSPARAASAVSSSAASIAESSRGTSSTRPAEMREVSSTSTTRRSRSGCQVRTTTLRLRAVARQSIERTSSPRTYSRSESNSVPWPRTRTADRPSRSRSRASREGRCLRDSNGGTRPDRARRRRAWPAAPPARAGPRVRSGDARRAQVAAAPGPQRRWSRACGRRGRAGAGAGCPVAPAVGCQASRTSSVVPGAARCWPRPSVLGAS